MRRQSILSQSYSVSSIYFSTAVEFETDLRLRCQVYDFRGAESWRDVALQALLRAGWRPDCAIDIHTNLAKTLPPVGPHNRLVFGTWGQMPDFEGMVSPTERGAIYCSGCVLPADNGI